MLRILQVSIALEHPVSADVRLLRWTQLLDISLS